MQPSTTNQQPRPRLDAEVRPFSTRSVPAGPLRLSGGGAVTVRALGGRPDPAFERLLLARPAVAAGLSLSALGGGATWHQQVASARRVLLLAERGGRAVAAISLVRRYLSWMRHLVEIDLLIDAELAADGGRRRRERTATGVPPSVGPQATEMARALLRRIEPYAAGMGARKLVACVPRSLALRPDWLVECGFRREATLADWLLADSRRTADLDLFTRTVADAAVPERP
ncbi:MAG: hypothetical protein DWQ36_11705 [Acidobacteria bacterium]|nr:MAG: hypothetical protein DWQ30_17985 [Acidobacteriota bacterium]REK07644.1 MAG: hypothetical protein DWQ36_11705 [Acidobacteriota bacterium]